MNNVRRHSFAHALGAAVVLILGFAACTNGQSGQTSVPEAKNSPFIRPDFAEAAAIAPSFAGFFYSSPGSDTLVVAVADLGDAERARDAVLSLFAKKRGPPPYRVLTVRKVNYSLLKLNQWLTPIEKQLWALPQVTGLGIDEGSNTITVGTRRNGDNDAVQRVMQSSRVPQNAYRLELLADCPKAKGCALEGEVVREDPPPA